MSRPRAAKSRVPVPREAEVLRACLKLLAARKIPASRQNTGVMRMGKRFVRFGEPGRADISGTLPGGIRIEIETKRPGNRPSPLQVRYLRHVNEAGAVGIWIDSPKVLDAILTKLLAGWRVVVAENGDQELVSPDEEEGP